MVKQKKGEKLFWDTSIEAQSDLTLPRSPVGILLKWWSALHCCLIFPPTYFSQMWKLHCSMHPPWHVNTSPRELNFSVWIWGVQKAPFFFFFFINLFTYLFIFGRTGSSLLHAGFLQLRQAGATLPCGARASHCGGFSCCKAQALGVQASVVAARGLSSCGSRA